MSTLTYESTKVPLALLALATAAGGAGVSGGVKAQSANGVVQPVLTFDDTKEQVLGSTLIFRYLGRVLQQQSQSSSASASSSSSSLQLVYGGHDARASTQIDFFLEFAPLLVNKDTLTTHATTLNTHLATRTYFVSHAVTVADFAVYDALLANTRWSTFAKTSQAQFPHLFRWQQHITSLPVVQAVAAVKQQAEEKRQQAKIEQSRSASFELDLGDLDVSQGVVTRFPPEPSGYLHIGHAKAALLNDTIARKYNGKLILRFDDTNPKKEKEEYVDNIFRDLTTLGIKWDVLSHTSDHFDLILKYADQMILTGKAYVDTTPVEQMRKERMDGIESPCRSHSVEENMRLWKEMQAGSEEGLKCCMRAKIDMQAFNKAMRDPTIYRCNLVPHHRTGAKYKVYPTYDFACPIVDSIEGVTLALRANEYRDRNEQFYWMIDALGLRKPLVRDYSRLNFVYTTLSKRKLTWFVDSKLVDGWDDPRFPTIQGIMRRGMTVKALREFVLIQGFSQTSNLMEWDKIWTVNKRVIDPVCPRFNAIGADGPVQLVIDNVPDQSEAITVDLHPKNKETGTKVLTRSNRILIEAEDAKMIQPGEEVTLMSYGNAVCHGMETQADGSQVMRATFVPNGDVKKTDKKLTWVDHHPTTAKDAVPLTLIELDTLITVPKVEEDMNFDSIVREKSWFETPAYGESALRMCKKGDVLQLNRRGYFIVDAVQTVVEGVPQPMKLIFIPDGRAKAVSVLGNKVEKARTAKSATAVEKAN